MERAIASALRASERRATALIAGALIAGALRASGRRFRSHSKKKDTQSQNDATGSQGLTTSTSQDHFGLQPIVDGPQALGIFAVVLLGAQSIQCGVVEYPRLHRP